MTPQAQRYRILERLDAGGMAEVFKGKITSIQGFDKLVAIKRILPDLTKDARFIRMFLDEAKLSLYLDHTNIVHVFDIGHADGTYFIVMEYIHGGNLKHLLNALLARGEIMPIEQAVFIATEVCKGLAYAHERLGPEGQKLHIVHRDISPPNILISRNGEVKLTDFGLAKATTQLERTDPGVVKGKFGYLSPEAAYGQEVDHLTDIFAVGIVLWEMLASRRLFLGSTDLETLQQVRRCKIPSIRAINPNVPAALEGLLNRILAREKSQRPQTAQELGAELNKFLFAHGKAVSNHDIAQMMTRLLDQPVEQPTSNPNGVIDILIQHEIDKLISVEEMEGLAGLNLVGAQPLPMDLGDAKAASLPDVGFEDPRTWSEIGEEGSVVEDVHGGGARVSGTRPSRTSQGPSSMSGGNSAPRKAPTITVTPADRPLSSKDEPSGTSKVPWIIFGVLLLLLLVALGVLGFTFIQR